MEGRPPGPGLGPSAPEPGARPTEGDGTPLSPPSRVCVSQGQRVQEGSAWVSPPGWPAGRRGRGALLEERSPGPSLPGGAACSGAGVPQCRSRHLPGPGVLSRRPHARTFPGLSGQLSGLRPAPPRPRQRWGRSSKSTHGLGGSRPSWGQWCGGGAARSPRLSRASGQAQARGETRAPPPVQHVRGCVPASLRCGRVSGPRAPPRPAPRACPSADTGAAPPCCRPG